MGFVSSKYCISPYRGVETKICMFEVLGLRMSIVDYLTLSRDFNSDPYSPFVFCII